MALGFINVPSGGSSVSRAGPPTRETPGAPSTHYYDTEGKKEYICHGKDEEGGYVWELAGSENAGGGFVAQEEPPENTKLGWIDTANGNIFKFHNGEAWIPTGSVWG